MIRAFIFITLGLLITATLIYRKRRFKPELLVWLLIIFLILILLSIFFYFTSHAEVWILISVYAVILILIFFGIGKNEPIKRWKDIFRECRRYILGSEVESKRGLDFLLFMHKKSHIRLKEDFLTYLLAAFITTLLYISWIILKMVLN